MNSFYIEHHSVILTAISIIFVLFLIIIALLVSIQKSKKTKKLLLESKHEIDILNKNLERTVLERTEELQKQEVKIRYLFDNTIEGIVVFQDSKCVDINDAGIKLFHFNSREEALDMDRMSFVAQESKEVVMNHLQLKTTTPYEIKAKKADGTFFPALVTGRSVTIDDQSLRISCVFDLTKLKEKEKELKITTEYLNRFYNNNGIGILLVDKNRTVIKINEKLAKLWGYNAEELIGKSAETFHISQESYKRFGKIAFEQALYQHKIDIEYQFKRKDGSLFWAKFSGEKINSDDVLWIITDIDQLKVKEQELIIAKQKAEESTRLKSEFLANMSHEIRTPMNSIMGMSFLALQTPLNHKQQRYLSNIQSSAKNLLNIINDILDFSKIEAGKLAIEKTNFNMKELLTSIQTLFAEKASEKNLYLSIEHSCSQDYICYGDSLRISQILINLVGNAIKFTAKGSIKIEIARVDINKVRFEVKDTGIGISEQEQHKLFQSFSQADGSTTRKYGGTGLGLSISKQLVELMNGKIWIESKPDIGSNFIFEIELKKGDISKVKNRYSIDLNIQNLESSKILLVEDNLLNQEIVIGLLENSTINIDIASNGKEAIEMCTKNSYKLILMDLQMPIMGGLEASKIIRETDADIPIIALSANIMKENIEATKRVGINEYLSKPIEVEKFYELLIKYLPKKTNFYINPKKEDKETIIPTFIHIDTKVGLAHMGQNKKLYLKILKKFYKNYKNLQFAKLNDNELQRVFHTIKGLSSNIGAIQLSALAQQLEENFSDLLFQEFYMHLHTLLNELQYLEETNEPKPLIELDKKKRTELFNELKKYAQKRRARECKRIVEELQLYTLDQDDQLLVGTIEDYLTQRDYKSIISLYERVSK